VNLKKNSKIVWLRVSPKIALKRLGDVRSRPLIDPKKPLDSICDLLEQRRPFYEVADYQVDTDQRSLDGVAETILNMMPHLDQ